MKTNLPANSNSFLPLQNDTTLNEKTGSNNQAALANVADQFEAIFIENLLKQARSSKLSDDLIPMLMTILLKCLIKSWLTLRAKRSILVLQKQ